MKNRNHYFFHTNPSKRTTAQSFEGRSTVGAVYNPDNRELKFAVAKCGPNDQFEKKIGRNITIGRIEAGKFQGSTVVPEGQTPGSWFVKCAVNLTSPVIILE